MALLVLALITAVALDAAAWLALRRNRTKRRGLWLSLVLAVNATLFSLAALDAGFYFFMRQSDGFNLTMSSRNWFADHWKPINSLGYRDDEPAPPAPGQTAVLVTGDSFVAGHGIDDYRDRFSNVLGRELGDKYKVYNVADIGWDSADELKALTSFPVKPDIVVLSYYLNDVFGPAYRTGFYIPFGVRYPKSSALRYLVDHSALVNFVYWRLVRSSNMSGAGESFWGGLQKAYADPGVWAAHAKELDALVAFCREKGARLIVLVFPNLQDVAASAPLTGKVASYFEGLGVTTFDLAPMFQGRDPRELVVNAVDAHPNARVHEEIAGLLQKAVAQ